MGWAASENFASEACPLSCSGRMRTASSVRSLARVATRAAKSMANGSGPSIRKRFSASRNSKLASPALSCNCILLAFAGSTRTYFWNNLVKESFTYGTRDAGKSTSRRTDFVAAWMECSGVDWAAPFWPHNTTKSKAHATWRFLLLHIQSLPFCEHTITLTYFKFTGKSAC